MIWRLAFSAANAIHYRLNDGLRCAGIELHSPCNLRPCLQKPLFFDPLGFRDRSLKDLFHIRAGLGAHPRRQVLRSLLSLLHDTAGFIPRRLNQLFRLSLSGHQPLNHVSHGPGSALTPSFFSNAINTAAAAASTLSSWVLRIRS